MGPLDLNLNLPDAEKIKTHFRENEKLYKGVALGVLIGLSVRRRPVQIINTVAPIFHNNNSSNVLMGGHLSKIVRCNETGQIWESVTATADAVGVPIHAMSRHLNGHTSKVAGKTFSILGVRN